MKFSTRSSYGLRALSHLAKNYNQPRRGQAAKKPYSLAKIAREEKISQAYLERLFAQLKRAGLVMSSKGMAGGYQLTKDPAQIAIFDVISTLEGSISVFHCVNSKGKVVCGVKACPSAQVYQKVQKAIADSLRKISLKDLI
ncbi:MAG: Rrf2 family transcriptional regulator [Candidatus Buchananbacteria bacterium]|jgi:Rrf2 family protein